MTCMEGSADAAVGARNRSRSPLAINTFAAEEKVKKQGVKSPCLRSAGGHFDIK